MRHVASWPHTPGASRTYELLWEEAEDDPIVSETYEVVEGSGVTITAVLPDGTMRRFRAEGGTDGTQIYIRHSVVFTSGDEDSRVVRLVVGDR